jgi:hypothetical protein
VPPQAGSGVSQRLALKQVENIFQKSPKTSCKADCSGANCKIDIAQNTLKNKAYGYGPVDE